MKIETLSENTTKWAKAIPEIAAVILFGSRAKGTDKDGSDWDVCCLVNDRGHGWYGTWIGEADNWKQQFCVATGLSDDSVQFVTSTSDQVVSGLLECSRVLYVHRPSKT